MMNEDYTKAGNFKTHNDSEAGLTMHQLSQKKLVNSCDENHINQHPLGKQTNMW